MESSNRGCAMGRGTTRSFGEFFTGWEGERADAGAGRSTIRISETSSSWRRGARRRARTWSSRCLLLRLPSSRYVPLAFPHSVFPSRLSLLTTLSASEADIPFSQFTVVIVSFTRVDTLLQIAQNLQRSIYVKEILLAWNDLEVSGAALPPATPC